MTPDAHFYCWAAQGNVPDREYDILLKTSVLGQLINGFNRFTGIPGLLFTIFKN